MSKKLFTLLLVLGVLLAVNAFAKGEAQKIRAADGPTAVNLIEMESKSGSFTQGMNFKKYILSGTLLGTSSLEYALAYFPRSIAVGADGTVHVAWCTEGDPSNEVHYVRSVDHGESFSDPVEVHDGYYGYKPSIAVDPNDPMKVYVAYVGYQNEGETRSIRVSASTDGGLTWGASVPIFGSVINCNNPYIDIDSKGWVHVAFDNYTDTYTRYNYSTDGGQTWLDEPVVVTIGFSDDTFAAALAIDKNDNIHVLTGGGGSAGSWGDKGIIWTWLDMSSVTPGMGPMPQEVPPVQLSEPGTGLPYPTMVFDSKNVGHLWYDNVGSSGYRDVFYRKYENGTWEDAVEIPSVEGGGSCGASASIDANDNLYLMYLDMLGRTGGFDLGQGWRGDIFTGTNASGEWQYVNLTADGEDVVHNFGDCAQWVADDSLLHLVYSTGTAAPWQIMHEIGYPWPPEPTCGINSFPDTYNLTGPFTITASTGDIDGEVVNCLIHVWQNDSKIRDAVEMTRLEKDSYEYVLEIEGEVGDTISFQAEAIDNDDYQGVSIVNSFVILEPKQPNADLLVITQDARLPDFYESLWGQLLDNVAYEVWDIAEHSGIDASVTNYGWNTILLHGWVVNSVPTRGYEGNPYAVFLQAGTEDTPKNFLVASMDWFFAAGETGAEELVFEAGDFAYDFFGIASGTSDPAENADVELLGAAGDPISGSFADEPLVLHPELTRDANGDTIVNWIDWTGAIEYDNDIFIAANEGYGSGVKYDGGTFKTIHLPWMLCHLVSDTMNTPQEGAVTLMQNIFTWFGTDLTREPVSGVADRGVAKVDRFEVSQNYPNPFNPVTHIDYYAPETVNVELTVYNSLGQKVKTLVNKRVAAGTHSVIWNGTNEAGQLVTSGTYFYKIKAGDVVKINKMVLLK